MAAKVRIGISGWTYKPWRGVFYPAGLAHRKELAFAASLFPSIEINGTFYRLQRPSSFVTWARETPPDFVFSIKGSRYITHMLRLRNIETALANFFASGLLSLGEKLGPILWQFPPNFQFNADLLHQFFTLLPRDTRTASALAEHHDGRVGSDPDARIDSELEARIASGCLAQPGAPQRIRHAIEIRHQSFRSPEFIRLLRRHDVALVCADTVEWPRLMDITSDFVYCRLHGSEVLYTSGYKDAELDTWAARVAAWACGAEVEDGDHASPEPAPRRDGRDVFVYFDNDAKVFAPTDAQSLALRTASLL